MLMPEQDDHLAPDKHIVKTVADENKNNLNNLNKRGRPINSSSSNNG